MDFEIDVSGEDILNDGYTIVVADKNNTIKGFKFHRELIQILRARQGEGRYRYQNSKQGKSLFRVRLYCIAVYYLFRSIKHEYGFKNNEINLRICEDFQGHEQDINSNLMPLLKDDLGLIINRPIYQKLSKGSNADKYAYLMRKDTKNQIKGYIDISMDEFEYYLKKK